MWGFLGGGFRRGFLGDSCGGYGLLRGLLGGFPWVFLWDSCGPYAPLWNPSGAPRPPEHLNHWVFPPVKQCMGTIDGPAGKCLLFIHLFIYANCLCITRSKGHALGLAGTRLRLFSPLWKVNVSSLRPCRKQSSLLTRWGPVGPASNGARARPPLRNVMSVSLMNAILRLSPPVFFRIQAIAGNRAHWYGREPGCASSPRAAPG